MDAEIVKLEIAKLDLAPGDVLVMRVTKPSGEPLTAEETDRMREYFAEILPDGVTVAVYSALQIDFEILHAPAGEKQNDIQL